MKNITGMFITTKIKYSYLANSSVYTDIKTPSPQNANMKEENFDHFDKNGARRKAMQDKMITVAAHVTGLQNSCLSVL